MRNVIKDMIADIETLAFEVIVDKLVLCNQWIELLENDLECLDNGEYIGQMGRSMYVAVAKIERELWLSDLREIRR
jgi:hypothetical protein